jgi:hypothetical protein
MNHISFTAFDEKILRRAAEILENESFVGKITELTGEPVSRILKAMPKVATVQIQKAVRAALRTALKLALNGFDSQTGLEPPPWMFKVASGLAGGASGFIGLPALAIELPVTTVLILRSIAGIARKKGENLNDPEVRFNCLEVLSLSPRSRRSAARGAVAQTSYYAARAFLARAVSEATANLLERGVGQATAPAIVDLVGTVAGRFGVVVTQKSAAGAIPVVGAIGGAAINLAFMDHFQKLAWAHFSIRKLERKYGRDQIRVRYEDHVERA